MIQPAAKVDQRVTVDDAVIQEIIQKIATVFHPRRIILFGSRARGQARPDSDVDLLIEMETNLHPVERRIQIRRLFWPPPCAMDFLVYTPAELGERQNVIGSIVRSVLREGKVLYEQTGS
jgi:hypothetical protein